MKLKKWLKFLAFNIKKKYKKNGIDFVSFWTNIYKVNSETHIFINSVFPNDYFFNRIICQSSNVSILKESIQDSKSFIETSDLEGYFYLQSYSKYLTNYLKSNCFHYIDTLYTLISPKTFRYIFQNKQFTIEVKESKSLNEWNEIFCRSFLIKESKYVKKILKNHYKKFILLRAEITQKKNKNMIVGCGLLFESNGCIGLYCLGTHPNYRNKGIASKVIEKAIKLSTLKGFDHIFLNTLLNDNYLDFYTKLNFKIVDNDSIYILK